MVPTDEAQALVPTYKAQTLASNCIDQIFVPGTEAHCIVTNQAQTMAPIQRDMVTKSYVEALDAYVTSTLSRDAKVEFGNISWIPMVRK